MQPLYIRFLFAYGKILVLQANLVKASGRVFSLLLEQTVLGGRFRPDARRGLRIVVRRVIQFRADGKQLGCHVDEYIPAEYTHHNMIRSTSTIKRRNRVPSGLGVEDAFGKVFRQIRKKRNLSQEMLARQTGFDRTFIGMLERGLASPSLRTLFRLAEGLRITPSQIIRRMERSSSGRFAGRM